MLKRHRENGPLGDFFSRNANEAFDRISNILARLNHPSRLLHTFFQHQLYVEYDDDDRTVIDDGVNELRFACIIRILPVPADSNASLIVLTTNYWRSLNAFASNDNFRLLREKFQAWLENCPNISIFGDDLTMGRVATDAKKACPPLMKEEINLLCKKGFLWPRRDTPASDLFWICHPKAKIWLQHAMRMREEVVLILRRAPRMEMLEADVLKRLNSAVEKEKKKNRTVQAVDGNGRTSNNVLVADKTHPSTVVSSTSDGNDDHDYEDPTEPDAMSVLGPTVSTDALRSPKIGTTSSISVATSTIPFARILPYELFGWRFHLSDLEGSGRVLVEHIGGRKDAPRTLRLMSH